MAKLTKKQQAKADAIMEAALQRYEKLHDTYTNKTHQGTIRWFDTLRGEGIISLSNDVSVYCHFSVIEGIDKNNYTWPTDADRERLEGIAGRACEVRVYVAGPTQLMAEHVKLEGL